MPDIKNAWIYPVTPVLFADTLHGKLLHEDPHTPGIREVRIAGRYGVRIEYMDSVNTLVEKRCV